jgi:hypothetical protein
VENGEAGTEGMGFKPSGDTRKRSIHGRNWTGKGRLAATTDDTGVSQFLSAT